MKNKKKKFITDERGNYDGDWHKQSDSSKVRSMDANFYQLLSRKFWIQTEKLWHKQGVNPLKTLFKSHISLYGAKFHNKQIFCKL